MVDEKLVPKLRFEGFTDNWEEITIKDYSTIKGRIGWRNLKQSEYTESGPYLIAGKHIHKGIINWDECDHLSVERYEESPEIALKKGDVIFSKDGSLGNPALIKELPSEATINGTMMLVRLNNKVSPNFFYQILNSDYFFRLLHILKSGSSIPHIFQRDMENFKFKIPNSYEEQNKISKFLENIDKKIELLENKFKYYNDFKKYLMQQIFAQKLRFADYSDDWKEVTLKDIGTFYRGHSYNSTNVVDNGLLVLRSNNIQNNVLDFSEDGLQFVDKDCKKELELQKNDIVICMSNGTRSLVGKSAEYTGNYANKLTVGAFCSIFRTKNKLAKYLFQTENYKKNLYLILAGTNINNLKNADLEKFKFNIPVDESEINKIHDLFTSIDNKIESNQKQLQEIIVFKKGLLQQMFI